MKIVLSGSSGLIGQALVSSLRGNGHDVVRLVRREPRSSDERRWDPASGDLDPELLRDADGVVNLAGAGLGDKRWTEEYKQLAYSSRIDSTSLIARTLADLAQDARPRVLASGSAIGIYGSDPGTAVLDENSPTGGGFLADLCVDWEAATEPAQAAGVRVVLLRTGLVMSPRGGALQRMLPLARLGVFGPLGGGQQYWSPISLDDEVRAIEFLLTQDDAKGPYNLAAPHPLTNKEFTHALGQTVHRPTVVPVPGFALRIVLGEFAQDMLGSARVVPERLVDAGFVFWHPDATAILESAVA